MKIFLTGAGGFVGSRILAAFPDAVKAPSLRNAGEEDVRRLVGEVCPDMIIHTAAVSDIGACEKDPDGSRRANVDLPLWLVRTGVKCILFSSDQVYGDSRGKGPYREEDAAPANLYAMQKLEMEKKSLMTFLSLIRN